MPKRGANYVYHLGTAFSESDPSSCFNSFTQDFPSFPLRQPPHLHFSYSLDMNVILPHDSSHFLHPFSRPLPDLKHLSLPQSSSAASSSTRKLKRSHVELNRSHSISDNNPQALDSIFHNFNAPPPIIPHSKLARNRRQKLSEKTRCLSKLMPWDKKMDTGTML
ncbi:hypothetical protein REPUB_Repub04eG0123400 [Reevesia pubescens]